MIACDFVSIENMGRNSCNLDWVLLLSLLLLSLLLMMVFCCTFEENPEVLLVLFLDFDSRVGSDDLWEIVHDQGEN